MVRHKAFNNYNSFLAYVKTSIPSDIYYSSAYYENPDAEMDRKSWIGSDLIFDIDADHIPTTCNKIHDSWICTNPHCRFGGKGITPSNCPICGKEKFEVKTWTCDLCIESAKEETKKLVDFLKADFGFSDCEIRTFFSGHRGYHIHINAELIRGLDSVARKEIVDYVSGKGLTLFSSSKNNGYKQKNRKKPFRLNDYGWNRRLKKGLHKFILNASTNDLINIGLKRNADIILKNKSKILENCVDKNRWDSIKGVSVETWIKLINFVKDMECSKIDTIVTPDIHRLIRAEGTLHRKTGLLKLEFPLNNLDDFDVFKRAVAFKEGEVNVLVSTAPLFRLGEQTFGPFKNQKVNLPTAAAVLLICKGRAEVAN